MGRFLSADWSESPATVPYAHLENPQTLNLYAYVDNNPINGIDADGHAFESIVAPSGSWGLDQMSVPSGIAIETDSSGFAEFLVDSTSGATTFIGTQTTSVTQQLVSEMTQNQSMSLSQKGLEFIERHEGYSDRVYNDSAGNPTIGYGHLIKEGEDFSNGITKEKAGELLSQDTKTAVDAVNSRVTAKLSQAKFDALVDFTYNLGSGNLGKSTLLKSINAGKKVVEHNFTDWNRAGGKVVNGLTIRRTDEWNLFSKGDYGGP